MPLYRPYHPRFWSAYVIHMRPYLLFVSGVAGLTGIAYSATPDTPFPVMIGVFIACFLGYGFGQALTDCTQVDTDSISAPYRPLSQKIIKASDVALVSMMGLVLVSATFVIGNKWNLVLGGAAVCGLASYTYFKRRWWWAGPIWNSWIVALLPLIGSLAMNNTAAPMLFEPTLLLIAVATAIAYSSFVIVGYLKDITADRATGYHTVPVVFGWAPTVIVGDVLQLSAAALYAYICRDGAITVWVVWIVGTLLAVRGQASLPRRNNAKEYEASSGIAATVRSFVWWNVAVVLAWQPSWWWTAPIFLAASEVTLRNRPAQQQI